MAFFSLSVATYPPGLEDFETHRKTWLWILIGALLMDILQTAVRGQLFNPWYYLILEVHYLLLSGLALIMLKNRPVQLVIATYMPASLLVWSLVVRHIIA
jgi:hypothetical protein